MGKYKIKSTVEYLRIFVYYLTEYDAPMINWI